jgi:uncharacterized protein YkwD
MKGRMWLPVLMGLMCLTTVGIVPAPGAVASPTPDATTLRSSYVTMSATTFETRLFARVNARRARHDCRPIRASSALRLAARRHSSLMYEHRELSHRLAGEADLARRVVRAGYTHWRILAENLAWGQSSPRAVFRAWVRSAGHRANLDNCRLRDLGVGVVIHHGRPWVTADFGRRRS